jgi:hypothetical protein
VDRGYLLADAQAAHRRSETRRARGKLALIVDEKLAAGRVKSTPIQANPSVGQRGPASRILLEENTHKHRQKAGRR